MNALILCYRVVAKSYVIIFYILFGGGEGSGVLTSKTSR